MVFVLLIINESKWKYQITLCIKENFPSYGIYKTVTTSNEIFPSDPLSSGKKIWIRAWTIYTMHPAHHDRGRASFFMPFVFVSLLKHIDVINSHDIKVLFLVNSDWIFCFRLFFSKCKLKKCIICSINWVATTIFIYCNTFPMTCAILYFALHAILDRHIFSSCETCISN